MLSNSATPIVEQPPTPRRRRGAGRQLRPLYARVGRLVLGRCREEVAGLLLERHMQCRPDDEMNQLNAFVDVCESARIAEKRYHRKFAHDFLQYVSRIV